MGLRMAIDPATFLADYWQRRPLLMRQALDPTLFTVMPDELAGMACEAELEARLVIEHDPARWEVRHGPFDASSFAAMPETHWTLLVQDVDKYHADVADLIDHFDFLPSWRIDDIMVSYAANQGGVGPHTDAYDVFLLQGAGRRRWRLSNRTYGEQDLLPDLDLRILADFDTNEDWVLDPGDVLYLPPGIAHWGVADGDCMTYSLGFRAPNQIELAADWYQHVVSKATAQQLREPLQTALMQTTRLDTSLFQAAQGLIDTLPDTDGPTFDAWLGCFLTEPKPQFQIDPPPQSWSESTLHAWLADGNTLRRHPWARLAWATMRDGQLRLFCNGQSISVAADNLDVVATICAQRQLATDMLQDLAREKASPILLALINIGALEPQTGQ